MKWLRLMILLLCLSTGARAQQPAQDETYIRRMLSEQVTAWNEGRIAGYLKGYWEHDSLLFIGKSGPTYGYEATLERYRRSYPDTAHMGMLTSTILSMQRLSPEYYFVTGRWALQRSLGPASGHYTLLLRRINGQWVIVVDHSS
jgi:ketosteroid isomerase-like protein